MGVPVGVIVNKADLMKPKELDKLVEWFKQQEGVDAVFTTCAVDGSGAQKGV